MTFDLPWPPSTNHLYRHTRNGAQLTDECLRFRGLVLAAVQGGRQRTLTGRLKLTVWCFAPDFRRRDISNAVKATEDALQAAHVFRDDSQIDEEHLYRRAPEPPHGRLLVEVEETAPATAAEEKALKRKAAPSVRYPCRA